MTYSYGPPHMAKQKQDDQPELTYSSCVRTQDVTQMTCRRRWMIGRSGERWSRISVLTARHDDDDDDDSQIWSRFIFCSVYPSWVVNRQKWFRLIFLDILYIMKWNFLVTNNCDQEDIYIYIYIYIYILIELPWLENPASTSMQHTEYWTAVSTLLGLISSV